MCQIVPMTKENMPCILEIWHIQFTEYYDDELFPDFWMGGNKVVESYLNQQIELGNAIVAKTENTIVGFMTWMCIDFHNEKTAFCPIVGHAAITEDKKDIYLSLHTAASQKWVNDSRFNCLWMIYDGDKELKTLLYDLGFGSYAMECCQKTSKINIKADNSYEITKANTDDVESLLEIANEANEYYSTAPIFLKKKAYSIDCLKQIVSYNHVFIARDDTVAIGVICFSFNQGYHIERLTSIESSRINYIGTYVRPEYRGMGVGTALLKEASVYCLLNDKKYIHVSYETANCNASKFWLKYFKPIIRSVRRTINKDANVYSEN